MSPLQKALPLILLLSGVLFGQATPVDCTPGTLTFTSATAQSPSTSNANTATPCRSWEISYDAPSTLTVLSLQFETSPDNSVWTAVPNTVCSSSVQPPCVIDGANPSTTTGNQTFSVAAYGRFVRINVTTFTGTGTLTVRIFGYKGLSARVRNSGGGGGGGGMTVAGTTNQIKTTGTCNDTAGTCTVQLPNASVTIDAATGNIGTPGTLSSGVGGSSAGNLNLAGGGSGSTNIQADLVATGTAVISSFGSAGTWKAGAARPYLCATNAGGTLTGAGSLFSCTLPANSLGPQGCIQFEVLYKSVLLSGSANLALVYGSSSTQFANQPATGAFEWTKGFLCNIGATNAQTLAAPWNMDNTGSPVLKVVAPGTTTGLAVDSTVDQTIGFSIVSGGGSIASNQAQIIFGIFW